MMDKWSRYVPPGFGLKRELKFFTAGAACAFVWSLAFFFRLYQARKGLYILEGAEWILSPEAQMPDFVEILDSSLAGFGVVAASAVPWILLHYLYHWQGSRSIYLMRRLPDSWELHRRCLTVPLAAMAVSLAAAAILLLIYFGIYLTAVPKGCLAPGQWQKLWRIFGM